MHTLQYIKNYLQELVSYILFLLHVRNKTKKEKKNWSFKKNVSMLCLLFFCWLRMWVFTIIMIFGAVNNSRLVGEIVHKQKYILPYIAWEIYQFTYCTETIIINIIHYTIYYSNNCTQLQLIFNRKKNFIYFPILSPKIFKQLQF